MKKSVVLFLIGMLWIHPLLFAQSVCCDSLTVSLLKDNGAEISEKNKVVLLPSGQEKFDDLFKSISQARRYVYLEYFNFR
ncbi:MAG TPA: cardiolipin synthase, partial [Candidatus Paraprevotella stercorigallinarum]|nr:cardiolipin synthase [Candidatus Paraprevotella stercorigallinarum]